MTQDSTTTPEAVAPSLSVEPRGSWLAGVLLSPVVWGVLITCGFYSAIPYLPVHRELATRYFCSHPLEYATTTLFFIGMAIVLSRGMGLFAERSMWNQSLLKELLILKSPSLRRKAVDLHNDLNLLSPPLRKTALAQRLRDVSNYVGNRGSSEGLEEHSKYLAELSAEKLHTRFGLVRTITWAVPILGFLGTVIGITIAIANVTPEQLDTSLGEVTGGLAVAFDTTALALGLSLVLVFASFLVERALQGNLDRVEEYSINHLSMIFPPAAPHKGPLLQAQETAAEQLVRQTELVIEQQTAEWRDSMETLRHRWTTTMETLQQEMSRSLAVGMGNTLQTHQDQLDESRQSFLNILQELSARMGTQLSDYNAAQEAQQTRFEQRLQSWVALLQETADSSATQLDQVNRQTTILSQMMEQGEALGQLQSQLSRNLETLRNAEAFEETLHSLNAAVHMLTNKTRLRVA